MKGRQKYTFAKAKCPKTKVEVMTRRFMHAKASLEIEGFQLTREEIAVFEECINKECTLGECSKLLKDRFPNYDYAIRA